LTNKDKPLWENFLDRYKHFGAHFHGEATPPEKPDLILEMRPHVDSQNWLWVYRPNGTEPTDEVKNAMCWEMVLSEMPDEERRAFLVDFRDNEGT